MAGGDHGEERVRTEPVRAYRGSRLHTKGWSQEGALRMLMNNLDPEVAEKPAELIVYGGTGKAARSWECFHAIVGSLKKLENDETLIVQSGKPVAVFKTHQAAPRVLIANSLIVPKWATWDEFRRLEGLGLTMYGQMTAGSWIYIGTQGILQGTYRDPGGRSPETFRGHAPGKARPHGRPRRDGRRPAPGRYHERRCGDRHRGGPGQDRAPPRYRICRHHDRKALMMPCGSPTRPERKARPFPSPSSGTRPTSFPNSSSGGLFPMS